VIGTALRRPDERCYGKARRIDDAIDGAAGLKSPDRVWDGAQVATWLDRRIAASKLDQIAADRRGYEARDDYDQAAAEEWVCRALLEADCKDAQGSFARRIKDLLAQDDYRVTGIHDDIRFERHVRSHLRRIAKMTKEMDGFGKLLRYQ
jgi:hypothetical protein